MKFFSGFSLTNEEYLFEQFIDSSEYNVSGFSYGAIKALDYVVAELKRGNRIDRLQLLSPAFFQNKDAKFKKLQLLSYRKDKELYLNQFLKSCFDPYEMKIVQNIDTQVEELDELLYYEWDREKLSYLLGRGVVIEVYLGSEDRIVDALSAKEYFLEYSTVTYIKKANHFLQLN